jgi:hypothetical protein
MKTILLSVAMTIMLAGSGFAQSTAVAPTPAPSRAENYSRTELYVGRSIPGGGIITDEAWEKFLGDVVTPLFPDGFTILTGRGQYREASGTIAKEPSHVLVFLYRRGDRRSAWTKIEKIRTEYKKQFAQESVMRVDITKSVRVSF